MVYCIAGNIGGNEIRRLGPNCNTGRFGGSIWDHLVGIADLTDKNHGYLVLKWPFQQSIKLSFHQHKEQGEMCLVSHAITIQVYSNTHLVPIPTENNISFE